MRPHPARPFFSLTPPARVTQASRKPKTTCGSGGKPRPTLMTTYKMLDIVGTSNTSVSDAIVSAVHRTGQTIEDMDWFEVKEIRGRLAEGQVAEYQVKVQIGFRLHASDKETGDAVKHGEREGLTPEARTVAAQVARKAGERERTDLARGFEERRGGSGE